MLRYGFKPLGGPNTSDIIMPSTRPFRLVRLFTSIFATSREEWFVVRNLLLSFTTLSTFSSVFVSYSCCTSFFNCLFCFFFFFVFFFFFFFYFFAVFLFLFILFVFFSFPPDFQLFLFVHIDSLFLQMHFQLSLPFDQESGPVDLKLEMNLVCYAHNSSDLFLALVIQLLYGLFPVLMGHNLMVLTVVFSALFDYFSLSGKTN